MKIRCATVADSADWDGYVNSRADSSPYSFFAWRQAIEEAYGHEAFYLIAESDNRIVGVLPLIFFRVLGFSLGSYSLPFCDIGGAIADSPEIEKALYEEVAGLSQRIGRGAIQFRSDRKGVGEYLPPGHYSVSSEKVRMLFMLPGSVDELWSGFKSKLRSQIRKAEKNGLDFSWGSVDDIDDFYRVFSRNMHELGSPVHSKKWIKSVLKYYDENARMGLIYNNGLAVGCGIIVMNARGVSIPWASTLREYNRLSPNMLMYWNFLKYAVENQKEIFDFGRSTPGEGTFRFKQQWGAKAKPLYWYSMGIKRGEKREGRNQSVNWKRDFAARFWKQLPYPVTIVLGAYMRKYISL